MTKSNARISTKAMLIMSLASAPMLLAGCPDEPCHGSGCAGSSGSDASIQTDPSSPQHYITSVRCDPTLTELKILFTPSGKAAYDGLVQFWPEATTYHQTDKLTAWWQFCNYTCNMNYDGSNPPMPYTFTITSDSGSQVPSPVTMNIPALDSGQCAHEGVQLQDGQNLKLDPGMYTCSLSGVLTSNQRLAISP